MTRTEGPSSVTDSAGGLVPGSSVGHTVLSFPGGRPASGRGTRASQSQRGIARAAEACRRDDIRNAQTEWDRVIHDKVLAALTIAARATSFRARVSAHRLAGEALSALGMLDTPLDGGQADIRQAAERWGLTLTGASELPEDLPIRVRDALLSAVAEALANVNRHAGVSTVAVAVNGDSSGVTVTLRDEGTGFDPTQPSDRFGLGGSIPGHMSVIGGACHVDSAPGRGTTITLTWSQQEQAALRLPSSDRGSVPMARHAAALLAKRADGRWKELPCDVVPMLFKVWRQDILTHADRRDAALAEACTRDRLTGYLLVDDRVADRAKGARRRGAKVTLRCSHLAEPSETLTHFRRALAIFLDSCGPESQLTASWAPKQPRGWGTLVIEAPSEPVSASAIAGALCGIPHILDVTDDEIWLDLSSDASNAPREGTAGRCG